MTLDTSSDRDATARLSAALDALPEDEREAVAEETLALVEEAKRVRTLIEPALHSVERGEARPLEDHREFMRRMTRKHDL